MPRDLLKRLTPFEVFYNVLINLYNIIADAMLAVYIHATADLLTVVMTNECSYLYCVCLRACCRMACLLSLMVTL